MATFAPTARARSTTGAFISNYTINADNPMGDITWSGTLTISGSPVIS